MLPFFSLICHVLAAVVSLCYGVGALILHFLIRCAIHLIVVTADFVSILSYPSQQVPKTTHSPLNLVP